jgi:phenylalanyl-tRNA synthetase beta subunit
VIDDLSEKKFGKTKIVGYRRMTENDEEIRCCCTYERLDLRIKEDLAEEIGRIFGYDKITDKKMPKIEETGK